MNLNPEFQRQLYLECSQARLIGIPLVLCIVFAFSYLIDDYRLGGATAKTALTLYLLITLLWGARQCAGSIIEEYRDRTWDTQRLSALGPWEMTWGKLFGSTVMVWYAGVICLAVYGLATDNLAALPLLVFYGICAALLVQSGGLLLGLLAVQRGQIKTGSILILAIIGFFSFAPWLTDLSKMPANIYFPTVPITDWYGMAISGERFHRISLLLALFWCGIGNYRLMTLELGMRSLPWAWMGFCVFLMVYLGGFFPSSSYSFSLAAFLVCSALTYIGILVERTDPMRIKRLFTYFQQQNWRRTGEELPIWWPTLMLTLPLALLLSLSEHPFRELGMRFHFYPLPIVLLLTRDCGLYLYFGYGKNPQRAFSLSLLSAALLYFILPGMFGALGMTGVSALFFPLWADSAGGALFCGLLQTGFILRLLYGRWKQST
ncbi:MAG: hypothetical protein ACXV7J_15245 [Methylomonas sp.]